ncbi:single-stranded DNA-binding protein [Actinocorallia aurantiaca]|uniref:Single-stranded DNA-binding protein n=1 Tax=Actinocorallia aurantiaca TaxID=46204 RepID=A0ABP6H831_9ACTN
MDEALTTLVGWVAARPLYTVTRSGVPFLSLRAGMTPRRFNRETGLWEDREPTFFAVSCWRSLAENANASGLVPGTPIVAHGRLRVREYEQAGERRFTVELEALALGPDLTRGKVVFQRVTKGGVLTIEDRAEAASLSDRAAGLSATPAPRPGREPGGSGEPDEEGPEEEVKEAA